MAVTRREFLTWTLRAAAGASLSALGGTVYATQWEPEAVDVTRISVRLPGLPPALDGRRLVHITDLHFGDWMTADRMRPAVEQINALAPDWVAITGDFFSEHTPAALDDIGTALRGIHAPVFGVLGNHDHWTDPVRSTETLRAAGVTLLTNAHRLLAGGLVLAGVDDIWERQHDLDRALTNAPAGLPVVLLAHEPDYADEVAQDGRITLMLSGHSHGGQVRLPLIGSPVLPHLGQKYPIGRYTLPRPGHSAPLTLYTNRGLGMIRPLVRLGCPPEITQITLRA